MKSKLIATLCLTMAVHEAIAAKPHVYMRVVNTDERHMYMAAGLVGEQVLSLYCDSDDIAFLSDQHDISQVKACFLRYPYGEKTSLDSGIISNGEYAVRISHAKAGYRENKAFPMSALNRDSDGQLRSLKEWAQDGGDVSVVRYWGDAPHDKRPTITRW